MINRVDKKTYSFNVEPTNEEEAIIYLYIQSFHEIVLIKKPTFPNISVCDECMYNLSISKDKSFSVKKWTHIKL